jgi:hypothetical protein
MIVGDLLTFHWKIVALFITYSFHAISGCHGLALLCFLRSIPNFQVLYHRTPGVGEPRIRRQTGQMLNLHSHKVLTSRWPNIIFLHLYTTLSCSIDYGTPKSRSLPFRRTHGPLSFAENANSITARITRLEWSRNRSNHAHSCRLGSWWDFSDFLELEKWGCRPRPGKEANPTTRIIPLSKLLILGNFLRCCTSFSFSSTWSPGLFSAGHLSSVRKVEPQRAQFEKKSIAWSCQGRTSTCRDSL